MKTALTLGILLSTACISVFAQQVPKQVVLEHFTNTYCPPCASRNPALYVNLAAHPEVHHISYHPSSPYPSCTLYQHNTTENDARTNFYSVYGSTPRIVLQGTALPSSTQFYDTSIFTPALGQLSSFDITAHLTLLNSSTLRLTVTILKVDTSSLTGAGLYGVIAEDTLQFTTNNGEPVHYDVFRKAVWAANPQNTTLPPMVNTSISLMQDISVHNDWDLSKVFAMVMLHDGTEIIQAGKSNDLTDELSIKAMAKIGTCVYPNPALNELHIGGVGIEADLVVSDMKGAVLLVGKGTKMDISGLASGLYMLSVSSDGKTERFKIVKQ